ncbi:MAG: DUF1385 domain-containing protein [Clostridiales bacterium]|nr:DUF1385 domain-containing protein [Clostridiales bacterium]
MKNTSEQQKDCNIGGQALIEGVMMKGEDYTAIAVRTPKGDITINKTKIYKSRKKKKLMSIPVLRGGFILIDAMIVGVRSLLYAAEIAEEGEKNGEKEIEIARESTGKNAEEALGNAEEPEGDIEEVEIAERAKNNNAGEEGDKEKNERNSNEETEVSCNATNDNELPSKMITKEKYTSNNHAENKEDIFDRVLKKLFKDKAYDAMIYISVFFALLISIGIFMLAPTLLASYVRRFTESNILINIIEGIVRIFLFVGYIVLIARMEDIRRVFQYHGAEHKAIYCYEHKKELTVENARKFSTLHPRCGTSFLFIVMVVSMLLFSLVGWPNPFARVLARLALLPVVAGISYEIIRIASKSQSKLVGLVNYPGMMLQKLTTKEPDDSQLEVALEALKNVLKDDKNANSRANNTEGSKEISDT